MYMTVQNSAVCVVLVGFHAHWVYTELWYKNLINALQTPAKGIGMRIAMASMHCDYLNPEYFGRKHLGRNSQLVYFYGVLYFLFLPFRSVTEFTWFVSTRKSFQ
jgi:hypothetical protein